MHFPISYAFRVILGWMHTVWYKSQQNWTKTRKLLASTQKPHKSPFSVLSVFLHTENFIINTQKNIPVVHMYIYSKIASYFKKTNLIVITVTIVNSTLSSMELTGLSKPINLKVSVTLDLLLLSDLATVKPNERISYVDIFLSLTSKILYVFVCVYLMDFSLKLSFLVLFFTFRINVKCGE